VLGICDSFAAIFGSLLGKKKILGKNKTYFGLASFIISGLAYFVFLQVLFGVEKIQIDLQLVISILFTGLLEAYTEEIDNILLTYFSYLLVLSKNS